MGVIMGHIPIQPNHTVFEWETSCVDFMDVIMGDIPYNHTV